MMLPATNVGWYTSSTFYVNLNFIHLILKPKILSADSCLNETMQHKNHQVQLLCYAYISKRACKTRGVWWDDGEVSCSETCVGAPPPDPLGGDHRTGLVSEPDPRKSKRRVWHIGWGGSVHCARYEGALPIGFWLAFWCALIGNANRTRTVFAFCFVL